MIVSKWLPVSFIKRTIWLTAILLGDTHLSIMETRKGIKFLTILCSFTVLPTECGAHSKLIAPKRLNL